MFAAKDERRVDQRAMDRFTQFLLGGYIDEAIESATSDGLFFDAFILAHRMFGNDRRKMEQIESKLLSYRDPQHPSLTLLSVASQMPVPILSNMSATDDTSAWRAHIAIVLANLNNDTAMYTVHQLGLALSRKEFNAAADFCFLAVNLLTQHDCFAPVDPSQQSEDEEPFRRHITLINASLPDDDYYSTKTRYGWSIVDFQATEIYDFALKMSQRPITGGLTASLEYQKCRLEYAQMLAEYGGAATSAFKYCTSIATCIWDKSYQQNASTLNDLCDLADRLHCAANQTTEELQWVPHFRGVAAQLISNELLNLPKQADSELFTAIQDHSLPDANFIIPPISGAGFRTSTPVQPLGFVPHPTVPPQPHQFYNSMQNNLGVPVSEAIDIGATPATTPHKNDDEESILPLHQPHSHYHHQQQSPELRKHSLVDNILHNNLINSSKEVLGFGSSTTLGKDDEESILPVHQQQHQQLPQQRQPSIEHSIASQSPPPQSPPLQIQQHQPSNYSEPQLSPSFYPQQQSPSQQHFSFQPTPQQQQYQQQQRQRQRTDSQQFSDSTSQQQPFQPPQPPAIPSQDFSAFSQALPKAPETSMPEPVPQQQLVQQPLVQQPQQMQQQQHPQPQVQKQQQPEKKHEKSGGLFGGLAKKIVKYIPTGNEMKLPDDSKSSITWDEKLGRWVGEGIEEPVEVPPPPMTTLSASGGSAAVTSTTSSSGPLQASSQPQQPAAVPSVGATKPVHRRPGASRYANAGTIVNSPVSSPEGFGMPQFPSTSMHQPYSFMPTVPDDVTNGEEAANPFSYFPSQSDNTTTNS
uniref:Ancestral coatomer element 1 Sec16/Sec31 domain-containing protein n=1 Tax=Panagrolaimus superbus TaxID=310955 RepID=A0A914YRK5_9BILA